jgi:hypothetical protein
MLARTIAASLALALASLLAPRAVAQTGADDTGMQAPVDEPSGPADQPAQPEPEPETVAEAPPEEPPYEEAPLPTAPADVAAPGTEEILYDHRYQVGVRVGFGFAYQFAIKYGDGAECSDPAGETFCRHLIGGLIDVELTFGVTEGLEIGFLGRFGLANDPVAENIPIVLGLGIRGYIPPPGHFKAYIGAKLIMDLTQSDLALWEDIDVGARAEIGVQYDILRYLGVYLQFGVTVQILRAFAFPLDVTGGLQARFP